MTEALPRSYPYVSVIIPCFNAGALIEQLLNSLEAQSLDHAQFEVVCIDNGSSDNTLEVLEEQKKRLSMALIVGEESRAVGSYAARNRGIELAKGDVLFFTDADCRADPEWLERGLEAILQSGPSSVIGGQVELVSLVPDSPSAVEMFEMILGFSQRRNVEENGCSVTANLICWRECMSTVGPFNSQLLSKGDFEWCSRARDSNYSVSYAQLARVFHPARRTVHSIIVKTRRVTGGQVEIKKLEGANPHLVRSARALKEQFRLVLSDRRFPRLNQKLRVLGIAFLVFIVKTFEKIRLSLGAQSERR